MLAAGTTSREVLMHLFQPQAEPAIVWRYFTAALGCFYSPKPAVAALNLCLSQKPKSAQEPVLSPQGGDAERSEAEGVQKPGFAQSWIWCERLEPPQSDLRSASSEGNAVATGAKGFVE